MMGPSTTITPQGRALRSRMLWAAAAGVALVALSFVFTVVDRGTVVDGPTGSTFVTTATGTAALFETLDRVGRDTMRVTTPISSEALRGLDTYVVADQATAAFQPGEIDALVEFREAGGTVVVLGPPPTELTAAFGIDVEWSAETVGEAEIAVPTAHVTRLEAPRFGAFTPGHAGTVLAGSAAGDLVVSFDGVVLISDGAVAHNATVDLADNVDFLGALLTGRVGFDEFHHGFREGSANGLLDAAPGNWEGASLMAAVALVVILVSYGRRFGSPEPSDRALAPDRAVFLEAVGRALRRVGGALPVAPLREAVWHRLGVGPDAAADEVARRARQLGLDDPLADEVATGQDPTALDRALAATSTRRPR